MEGFVDDLERGAGFALDAFELGIGEVTPRARKVEPELPSPQVSSLLPRLVERARGRTDPELTVPVLGRGAQTPGPEPFEVLQVREGRVAFDGVQLGFDQVQPVLAEVGFVPVGDVEPVRAKAWGSASLLKEWFRRGGTDQGTSKAPLE